MALPKGGGFLGGRSYFNHPPGLSPEGDGILFSFPIRLSQGKRAVYARLDKPLLADVVECAAYGFHGGVDVLLGVGGAEDEARAAVGAAGVYAVV